MLDKTDDVSIAAENWLAQFENALAKPDPVLLKTLFHPDSHWRDVLALSWNIQTLNGAEAILNGLKAHAVGAAPPAPTPRRLRRSSSSRPGKAAAAEFCG